MFASIIEMLSKKGLMKNLEEERAENLFLEVCKDEMIPERWRIDLQNFIGEKFPEMMDKYTTIKVEETTGYNDLDKYLDEEILDDRDIDQVVNDEKAKHKKDAIDNQGKLNEELKKSLSEAIANKDEFRKQLERVKAQKEQELKDVEEELVRLEKGEKLKLQERLEDAQDKKVKRLEKAKV